MKNKLRPCLVGKERRKAVFHGWYRKAWVAPPSMMVGGDHGGQIAHTVAIVEYEDGQVDEVRPGAIIFLKDGPWLKSNCPLPFPCAVGDTVYFLDVYEDGEPYVREVVVEALEYFVDDVCEVLNINAQHTFQREIWDVIHLDREKAEAELAGDVELPGDLLG